MDIFLWKIILQKVGLQYISEESLIVKSVTLLLLNRPLASVGEAMNVTGSDTP